MYHFSIALKGFNHIVTVQYFNPVIVRILDESQSFHFTIVGFLHKIDAETFKSLAGLFNVRNHDSDVTEPPWFKKNVIESIRLVVKINALYLGSL